MRGLTDEDLEQFDWYILHDVQGGVWFRIIMAERPA